MSKAITILALAALVLLPLSAEAQNPSAATETSSQVLKPQELDALVAPIALYPDTMLAEVLMASTYPLEVVQADRWLAEHKDLQGDRLKAAVEKQDWDNSVKSLVATPSVLTMMSTKLDWTQKLGDAVLAQQPDVMDAVQRLRSRAYANEKLRTSKEQKVTVKQEDNRQVIAIEPADPGSVYVPYYDPAVVYGEWPYPDYPPYYYYPEGYLGSGILATGIAFGTGYALARWATGGRFWGGNINWRGGDINVNRGAHVAHWQHNPQHRRGVGYNNQSVQQRFAGNASRAGNRQKDFRGRNGQQVLRPGGGQTKVGEQRPANRANAADRGQRKQAGQTRGKQATQARGRQVSRAPRPSPQARSAQHRAAGNAPSRVANRQPQRARANVGGARRGSFGFAARGGGGRVGGAGFRGGGRGRRSDIRLKHDIALLGRLDNGLGFYRFRYNGSSRTYVGVMAQEVQTIAPEAVVRGADGYLRVRYDKLGVRFQTYQHWIASGRQVP